MSSHRTVSVFVFSLLLVFEMTKAAELTFPFNINLADYCPLGIHDELTEAAKCGDLDPLHRLESEFGGVGYNCAVAFAALQAGQFQFWSKYVLMARWVCIVIERGSIGPWVQHLLPISDLLAAKIDERSKFEAFQFAIEKYLPSLPSREEFKTGDQDLFYYDHRIILPPHRYSIWCLDNFKEFPKIFKGDAIINRIMLSGNRDIIELLIKKGIKFSLKHLQTIGFKYRPDLYDLVLNNLRPHIDRAHIPIECQYPNTPNDAELLSLIAHAAEDGHYREADSLNDIIEFLNHNPQGVSKLPATVEFFQKVLDGHVTGQCRDQIADWFYDFLYDSEFDYRVPKALQISQILVNRFQNEIKVHDKAPLNFPSMSRYDRMLSHLRETRRGNRNVEDIPDHERIVIDDEYPDYPERDDNDDYAAWMEVVGHGYFEDFLGGSDEGDSATDQGDGEYSHNEENGDYSEDEDDDGEGSKCSHDEENGDYYDDENVAGEDSEYSCDDEEDGDYFDDEDVDGEGVEYSDDEDSEDFNDDGDEEGVEYSNDEDTGDDSDDVDGVRRVEYSIDEENGDYEPECSEEEKQNGNGSNSFNHVKHHDLQCAENSETLVGDRADSHAINESEGN